MVYSVTFQPNLHQLSFTGLPIEVPRLSLHTLYTSKSHFSCLSKPV